MSSAIGETKSLSFPKVRLGSLLDQLKIERNTLFSAWLLPDQGVEAETWWSKISEEERPPYRHLLEAVAAPALLATLSMVEDEATVLLRFLVTSTAPDSSAYLIREDEENFLSVRLEHRDEAVDTLWNLLVGDFPLWEMEWGASLSRSAFFTLLAVADLQQRKDLVALLEHTVLGPEFFPAEVATVVSRSFEHCDLRWLLPFFLTVLPDTPSPEQLQEPTKALEELCQTELLQSSEQKVYRLSPSGEFLMKDWQNRLSVASLQILGADHQGTPVASQVGFLRSRKFLWYLDPAQPGQEVLLSTPTVALAQDLLDELLCPLGEPRKVPKKLRSSGKGKKASRASGAESPQVLFCPYCGGKLAVADARFCNSCGKQLKGDG